MHLAILLINPKGLLALRIFIPAVGGGNKMSKTRPGQIKTADDATPQALGKL